jgi:site-specific recombinase XerD
MLLDELIATIIKTMKDAQYNPGTISCFSGVFSRLQKLARMREEFHYNPELGRIFIEDSGYSNSEGYCHSRYCLHHRCIQFIESYIKDGQIDWSSQKRLPLYLLKYGEFIDAKNNFEELMQSNNLKANTRDGYRRLVHYFLLYLEGKGYRSLDQIKNGDIVTFIVFICTEHYQPTSLGSHLSGLRMFLKMSQTTQRFEIELPERLCKKRAILEVYNDEEHERILQFIESSDMSLRNKAICIIALETGLRAVDICNLKLHDVDWRNDCIHIIQVKTGRPLNIPLKASYGNAIADYLLLERPTSDSEFIFLKRNAPFTPINSHAGCRKILFDAITGAGIEANGRSYGTRITRHSVASRMLRQGVPLPVISEALGHGNPNSVMVYLSTEGAKLAECTLPLPGKENAYAQH